MIRALGRALARHTDARVAELEDQLATARSNAHTHRAASLALQAQLAVAELARADADAAAAECVRIASAAPEVGALRHRILMLEDQLRQREERLAALEGRPTQDQLPPILTRRAARHTASDDGDATQAIPRVLTDPDATAVLPRIGGLR